VRRSKRLVAVTMALGLGVVLSAPPAAAATRKVTVFDNGFQPPTRVVQKGTRVRWVNQGLDRHSTTSVGGLWDANLDPGQAFPRKFRKVGTFRYFCKFHDNMSGKIRVVA
jgi:plastocyanin